MFDLSGIARHLKVTVDQIRIAADLLEQGFSPPFIERYRGDETSSLPEPIIQRLKYEIDRRNRIEAAKKRVLKQLPKDSVPDSEMDRVLSDAHSALAVDVAARCYRARRSLDQSHERAGTPGRLLEAMLTYSGPPVDDVKSWITGQLEEGNQDADLALSQVGRLVAALMSSDTALNTKLRQFIERNAILTVVDVPESASAIPSETASDEPKLDSSAAAKDAATAALSESIDVSIEPVTGGSTEPVSDVEGSISVGTSEGQENQRPEVLISDGEASASSSQFREDRQLDPGHDQEGQDSVDDSDFESGTLEDSEVHAQGSADAELKSDQQSTSSASGEASKLTGSSSNKLPSKLTPRQRRRRWLLSVLSSLRSTKKPVHKLTAYQQLMLARGVRSRLIDTPLSYDLSGLVEIARNSFTDAKHPFAEWFRHAVGQALEHGLQSRVEADAMAEMEERACESLLEHATDELRRQLMRRPVRGHTIALIDTVGPKSVSVVFVAPSGRVLGCEELPCSVHPEIVSQNVVKLGEWMHKHRVTLVALTNGPARRFMMSTLRELMQQSKSSGLRWTMADRSGAEAYAGGKIGLRELSTYNRRQRAAIWTARCLQDPLVELLKVDSSRLRLGSYQRELPQDAVKHQIQETLSACVCARGIDTQNASEFELQFIPGVRAEHAKQIVNLARSGCLNSRSQLALDVQEWTETDRRHALGWLRVFGSNNELDATLVHPEDYRLAERLIEHAGFSTPPNAPSGWVRRTLNPSPVVVDSSSQPAVNDDPSTMKNEPFVSISDTSDGIVEASDMGMDTLAVDCEAFESDESAKIVSDAPTDSKEALETPTADQTDHGLAESDNPIQTFVLPPKDTSEEQPVHQPEYPEQLAEMAPPTLTVDCDKLANQWQVGRAKLKSVAKCLVDPFGDPRLAGVPVPMLTEMPTLDNLEPDMCVWAIVVGVADFGAFVELSPNCSGLIHISRLSTQFIEDPHQCIQVGDLLMTWVVNIDRKKNRVALTALSPAQRAQMKEEADSRKAKEEEERQQRHRGGFRKDLQAERNTPRGQRQGSGNRSTGDSSPGHIQQRPKRDGAATGSGAAGSARSDNSGDRGRRFGEHGQGKRTSDRRGNSSGGDRGRGRDGGNRSSRPVVVTSKKPIAPISQAMKKGEEPLRSFSDLFQFYESNRTEEPSASLEIQPDAGTEDNSTVQGIVSDVAEAPATSTSPTSNTQASDEQLT